MDKKTNLSNCCCLVLEHEHFGSEREFAECHGKAGT